MSILDNEGHDPQGFGNAPSRSELERLRAENADLRRWKALDKPLTAAMAIANSHVQPLRAENERLRAALDQAVDLLCGARSGHVAGSQPDCEWDSNKAKLLRDYSKMVPDEQR